MALLTKRDYDATTLLASAARTTSSNGSGVRLPGMVNALAFTLDVTVDESTGADKLDAYIQTKIDGTNWLDVIHFTQHDGNAGAKRYVAKIEANTSVSEFEVGSALTETNARDLLGDEWRVKWTITDDSGNASFTFSVVACPM